MQPILRRDKNEPTFSLEGIRIMDQMKKYNAAST